MDNFTSPDQVAQSTGNQLTAEGFRADNPTQYSETPQTEVPQQNVDDSGMLPEQDLKSLLQSRKKERANPAEKRIKQVIFEKRAQEEENVLLRHQMAEKDAHMAEMQARIQQYDESLNAQRTMTDKAIEGRFLDSEESIRNALRQAKENGDIDRDVALTDQLAEIKAQKNAHELYRIQQANAYQQQIQNEPFIPYETNQVQPTYNRPVNVDFQEWVQENPWYQQNPRLRNEADLIYNELASRLAYNNHSQMIGTTPLFDTVTNIMNERYGQAQPQQQAEHQYQQQQYQNPQQNYVGPVNQRPTQAQQYMSNNYVPNGVPLTPDELMIARHLPRKANETEADSINRYRKEKAKPLALTSGSENSALTGTPFRYIAPM